MSNVYTVLNTESRLRIALRIDSLTSEEFRRPIGSAGWNVSGILLHLAFWDIRAFQLLTKWKKEGITPSPIDVDVVNESMRLQFIHIPASAATELVISSATKIDLEIEGLEPAFLQAVEQFGTTVQLNRADHRYHHLDQIEKALGKTGHPKES